jgi:hypothetical protein
MIEKLLTKIVRRILELEKQPNPEQDVEGMYPIWFICQKNVTRHTIAFGSSCIRRNKILRKFE